MSTADHLEYYNRNGYVILEDVILPAKLSSVQQAYEDGIIKALDTGHAEQDEATGFMKHYRFQNPHHPELVRREIMDAFSAESVMAFGHELVGSSLAFIGAAAFVMEADYDYRGSWHRDSYGWGKDSEKERSIRERPVRAFTQVLLALQDDESFWMVPGSHNRPNTVEEEARFEKDKTGWEELFPGAVQLKLRAGSALPFDARAIHRGLKRPGIARLSLYCLWYTCGSSRFSDYRLGPGSRLPDPRIPRRVTC